MLWGAHARAALGVHGYPPELPMDDSAEAPESTHESRVLPAWPSAYG
ncbi:MAG: hypothetical protein QGF29_08285 [Verrucomicrobiota bacterium]|nr:hypothetical protein [Verrucomicrobiota bacterium]